MQFVQVVFQYFDSVVGFGWVEVVVVKKFIVEVDDFVVLVLEEGD